MTHALAAGARENGSRPARTVQGEFRLRLGTRPGTPHRRRTTARPRFAAHARRGPGTGGGPSPIPYLSGGFVRAARIGTAAFTHPAPGTRPRFRTRQGTRVGDAKAGGGDARVGGRRVRERLAGDARWRQECVRAVGGRCEPCRVSAGLASAQGREPRAGGPPRRVPLRGPLRPGPGTGGGPSPIPYLSRGFVRAAQNKHSSVHPPNAGDPTALQHKPGNPHG